MLFVPAIALLGVFACPRFAVAEDDNASSTLTRSVNSGEEPRIRAWSQVLGWGFLLVLGFLVAASAIIVFSRRYLAYLSRGVKAPTPDGDVWSMHRLPDDEPPFDETAGERGDLDPFGTDDSDARDGGEDGV